MGERSFNQRGGTRMRLGAAALLAIIGVAGGIGASPARAEEEGNFLTNMFKYGGTSVPPSQPADRDLPYCPTVEVPEGGAAIRVGGEGAGLRHQVTLGRVARECTRLQDGTLSVKVGVEGQVLLGPAGAPGRFDAPVTITIKSGGKAIVSRVRRVAVPVPAGQAQGLFSLVEDNLVVPAALSQNYDIEVRLGAAPQRVATPKARKPPATSEERVATPGKDAAE
ncbi:hypothetical protein [Methylobacterium sp. J-068]|uniref:hypothetical protein n=1 Tax=Methylobacterium sp. J-068 TaxID=2836649 RepID=UPI001FBBC1FB|nr:hypothetical protein [Methylobacterium sp. J-068]MCJ2034584.1 hypothetical protein [Methylobacterium sp. J-068]